MLRRYPSPRHGTRRPDVILVHPDPSAGSSIALTATGRGMQIVVAMDTPSALIQVRQWQAKVLVVPLAVLPRVLASVDRDAIAGGLRIVAIAAPHEPARSLVVAMRSGVFDLVLLDDPPDIWVDRLQIAAREPEQAGEVPVQVALARLPDMPARDAWQDLLIDEALRRSDGTVILAARLLGMTRQALHRHLARRKCQAEVTALPPPQVVAQTQIQGEQQLKPSGKPSC